MRVFGGKRNIIVTLSVLLLTIGLLSSGAAAAPADSIEVSNQADGTTTAHTWNTTLPGGANGTLEHLVVNYTGTGANVTASGAFVSEVEANGTTATTSRMKRVNDTTLNVTLGSAIQVSEGDLVTFTVRNIDNPETPGTYTASIALNNSTETFGTTSESFTVLDGGYVNGTVTDGSGNALDGADVAVVNTSTQNTVTATPTDANGTYSTYVPAGSYTYRYTQSGYESNQTSLTVTADATTTQNVTLHELSDISGTVTDANGQPVSGLDVTVYNATTDRYVSATRTDSAGNYTVAVPVGNYTVSASNTTYAGDPENVMVTTAGNSVTQNLTVVEKGYLNGTVTDSDGNPIGGINLAAVDRQTNDAVVTTTNSTGAFSVLVAPGQYDLVAYNNPDYEFNISANITVSSGETTVSGLTLTETPDEGTITGEVVRPDGTPVSDAPVWAGDTSYRFYNSTTADSSGSFTLKVPEGTYRVRSDPPGMPAERIRNVSVTANETTTVELVVEEPAYITGQVTNESGPVPNVGVLADSGDGYYFASTNATGHYNITVAPGEYTTTVFANGQDASSKTVAVTAGNTTTADFSLVETEIVAKSVAIESGPGEESKIGVNAQVRSGLLQIQLVNESRTTGDSVGKPHELDSLGVTEDTTFNITITVTNFSADSLLWGINDANYTTTQNSTNPNATDITITGTPVTLQATDISSNGIGPLLFQSPDDVQWPTEREDQADVGFNQTVYIGVFDLGNVPGEIRDTLSGVSVTTNAQRFSTPQVVNDSLRIWIAGPSTTVDGETHSGFYQATIPDSQLNDWGVDDPETELTALYKGSERNFTVTETSDGARIRLENISYSAGYVEVEANPQTQSTSSGDSDSTSSDGDDGSTFESTSDDTTDTTSTPTATPTATPTDTPTSTPTATQAPTSTPETETETPATTRTSDPSTTAGEPTSEQTPGFGVVVAVVALVSAGLLSRRRS